MARGSLAAATATGRQHMGDGEFLSRASAPNRFRVETLTLKPDWRAHDPGDQIRAAFAGTSVLIDDEIFEVTEHQVRELGAAGATSGQAAHQHVYLLAPWDDRHPLRGPSREYSINAVRAERAAVLQGTAQSRTATRLDWWGVVVALLPARDQQYLAETYGFNAVFWTRWSALAWGVLAFGAVISTLASAPLGTLKILLLVLFLAFLAEQFFRRAKATVGQPCGSVLGHALRLLVPRALRCPKQR